MNNRDDGEDEASVMPVKQHISKLDEMLSQLKVQLIESKGNIGELQSGLNDLGVRFNNERTQIHNDALDETHRMLKEMREMYKMEVTETYGLRFQLTAINQDKMRIQQDVIVLENKVTETDKDIGFKKRTRAAQKI